MRERFHTDDDLFHWWWMTGTADLTLRLVWPPRLQYTIRASDPGGRQPKDRPWWKRIHIR
jgi:hypothetical protein